MSHRNFREMVESSERLVVASHLAPDYDAVCSGLLLARTVRINYPDKRVVTFLEDEPSISSHILGVEDIAGGPMPEMLAGYSPDALVIVDTNSYRRVTRLGEAAVRGYIRQYSVKTAVIDHHEPAGFDDFDIRFQEPGTPAATQMVYDICFRKIGWEKPEGYGLTAMTGIVADSGTFSYGYDDYSDTFSIVNELIKDGVSVQDAVNIIENLDRMQLQIIAEFAQNLSEEDGFNLSYLADSTAAAWETENMDTSKIKAACNAFCNRYISNVGNNEWGVVVYPNSSKIAGQYYASFRAKSKEVDVSVIARSLGSGGGHRGAAGVSLEARNIENAIEIVRDAIKKSKRTSG